MAWGYDSHLGPGGKVEGNGWMVNDDLDHGTYRNLSVQHFTQSPPTEPVLSKEQLGNILNTKRVGKKKKKTKRRDEYGMRQAICNVSGDTG